MSLLYKIAAIFCAALLSAVAPTVASAARFSEDSEEAREHFRSWGFPHREGVVLVLSGGGMKGLAHLGVLEVLERENIPIAAIVGTSMGAAMGGLYSTGYTTEEMRAILASADLIEVMSGREGLYDIERSVLNAIKSPSDAIFSITMDKNLQIQGRRGMLNAKNLYTFLSDLTSQVTATDFNTLPYPFAAVATDLLDGDTVVLRGGNLASALRASMSLPLVFEPWQMNDMLLVDGGLKANLPVIEAQKIFPGHPVVAVNLSPEHITKKDADIRSALDIMVQSLEILMIDQIRANAVAADIVISPDVKEFSVFEPASGYEKIIEAGARAAESAADELRRLVEEKCAIFSHPREVMPPGSMPIVASVRFDGVPEELAARYYYMFKDWIGWPLNMKLISQAVAEISKHQDILSVDGYTERISRGRVNVVFRIERHAKYEFGVDGYASNINANRWLSLSAATHDSFLDGDTAALDLRLGTTWGAMLRYFTPTVVNNGRFGLTIAARREKYEPLYAAGKEELERYTAKAAWYRRISDHMAFGIGYAGEMVNSYAPDQDNEHGPYLTFAVNNLDNPILPTEGIEVSSDIWFALGRAVVSNTRFTGYIPLIKNHKVVFGGGLKTGDGDTLSYAAMLGPHNELYSLGRRPLVGDAAYWLHLGVERALIRSWWGGVNLEIFGNYGRVLGGPDDEKSRWEAGLAFSLPTNNFNSKLVFVYDQEGGFTVGYSIGLPAFWDGPMP